jgi:hypothetical protein
VNQAGEPDDLHVIRERLRDDPPTELLEALRESPDELRAALLAAPPPELAEELRRDELGVVQAAMRRNHFARLLEHLTSFVVFVGYSRSGGSLVAALMDAHPNLVVAHELDLFEKEPDLEVTDRIVSTDRDDLAQQVLMHASIGAELGRQGQRVREDGSRYYSSYDVDGGWQGRYEALVAIGTKNAVESAFVAERFGATPFRRVEQLMGVPLRFVHVVRNPYDNIATMTRIHGDRSIVRYFKRADGVCCLKEAGFDVLDVHLDDVIEDPRRELRRIGAFYGVETADWYLAACADVVADRPSRTADAVAWGPGERRAIARLAAAYPWLARYVDAHEEPPV